MDFLKKLLIEDEEVEYTEWYFRTEERISSLDIFVSILEKYYTMRTITPLCVFYNAANNSRSSLGGSVCIFVPHANYFVSLIQMNVKQLQGIAKKECILIIL